jgi:multicomponent Na+:H+ antiporter subunit E
VIGVRTLDDVEKQRAGVLRWERRVVRALGDPAQYRALKADERAGVDSMKGGAR